MRIGALAVQGAFVEHINVVARGMAVATDLETAAILELPEVEGDCLIPHREVSELLKYVPGNEQVTIERKNSSLNLAREGGQASYNIAKSEDYPGVLGDVRGQYTMSA